MTVPASGGYASRIAYPDAFGGSSPLVVRAVVWAVIEAPRHRVYRTFTDVRRWPEVFATIASVQVLQSQGSTISVAVQHREGPVTNVLQLHPPGNAVLVEHKRHYDATFINTFLDAGHGRTLYVLVGLIDVHRWRRVVTPALGWYVKRQMKRLTIAPVRAVAEATRS